MKWPPLGCWFFLALAACATESSPPFVKVPYKEILAQDSSALFGREQSILVSEVRSFNTPAGSQLGVCLKAKTADVTGKSAANATYAVIIERNQIADRRRAVAEDECESEMYEPLKVK